MDLLISLSVAGTRVQRFSLIGISLAICSEYASCWWGKASTTVHAVPSALSDVLSGVTFSGLHMGGFSQLVFSSEGRL